jgi:hypothetical protein
MADKDSSGPVGGNLTSILAVVMLVVGAVWVTQVPLEGTRPPNPEAPYRHPGGLQEVDARMWEDPFDAVERYRKREQAEQRGGEERKQRQTLVDAVKCLSARSKEECNAALKDTASSEGREWRADHLAEESSLRELLATPNSTLLVVTVTGAPYGMASEWRRKQRYAILSGLHLAGFEPFDPEHIGFVDFDVESRDTKLPLPAILPYEVFYRRASGTQNLVVAWFNEDVLWSDDPLAQLHRLFERVAYEKGKNKPGGLTINVLGPGSSGILKQMVRELRQDYLVLKPRGATSANDLADSFRASQARFYASSPTAADASLVEGKTEASACLPGEVGAVQALQAEQRLVEAEFRCRGVTLERITVTDEKLADALADELQLRGAWQTVSRNLGFGAVDASDESIVEAVRRSPRVVLVSEWDTHYGREFPGIMRDALLADVPDVKMREAGCAPRSDWSIADRVRRTARSTTSRT